MRSRSIRFLTLFLLLALPVFAQKQDEPRAARHPWQWSDQERIAARLDPVYIASHSKRSATEPGKVIFAIDGRANPHLFLPFELFNRLMGGLSTDTRFRDMTRAMFAERIRSFGYQNPDVFWTELETVTAPHLALLHRNAALHDKMQMAARSERDGMAREIEGLQIPLCRSRTDALDAARVHFGRETFDRFLYTVVAANLSVSSQVPSADEARGLAYVQGGCR